TRPSCSPQTWGRPRWTGGRWRWGARSRSCPTSQRRRQVLMSAFHDRITDRAVVICCGPGGVGKTTTAEALAVEAARHGRRACVVTIDPAKRLADALGLESLTNSPGPIEGDWPGELWALMLDTKSTFDELVTEYAGSEEQADAILGNTLYRNISGALSGTQ